ncbi:MAG: hypothetical protein R3250_15535 [Melioribacteraceae bacterium]|nr:hypothetical protein [Melioribacteraceae bacterium]
MRRSNSGIVLIGLVGITVVVLFLVFLSFSKESDKDLYLRDVKEVESVNSLMIETNFHEQLINALKSEGYQPTGSIAYTIFSMEEKEITIVLFGLDSSKRNAEKYIQDLTNNLSTSLGLGKFEVKVREDKD